MKALLALVLLLASAQVLADELHVVRADRTESFTGCVTTRLYITARQAHLTMFCPEAPTIRKSPPLATKPFRAQEWDYYVSDAHRVWMGEGCSVRAHLQGAYSVGTVTELECVP